MSAWAAAVQSVGTLVLLGLAVVLAARLHWLGVSERLDAALRCPHGVSAHERCPFCDALAGQHQDVA